MAWEAILWAIFFLMNIGLIAFNLYQVLSLSLKPSNNSHLSRTIFIDVCTFMRTLNLYLVGFEIQIVCLSDLEADYMNPFESSSRINAVVVPEFILHGVLCGLLLLTGHWIMFLFTLPIACYNASL